MKTFLYLPGKRRYTVLRKGNRGSLVFWRRLAEHGGVSFIRMAGKAGIPCAAVQGGGNLRGKRIGKTALLLMAVFLTGCASGKENGGVTEPGAGSEIRELGESGNNGGEFVEQEQAEKGGSVEEEAEPAYEIPEGVPGICVNRLGYITKSDKIAIFCAEELPQEFHVIREDSGEAVFAGYLRDMGYNEARQEYNGYGDFSEVQESGTYYIEAPILGRSYSFQIEDNLYGNALEDICRGYDTGLGDGKMPSGQKEGVKGEGFLEAAGDLAVVLLAYELNAGVFTDDMGIFESGNEIPDLLDKVRHEAERMLEMQDMETGAVGEGVAHGEPWEEAFAMVLAKFSYLYQDYDTDFATECLRAADRAWLYGDSNAGKEAEDSQRDRWKLAAAAELYRASGKQSFHDHVLTYSPKDSSPGEIGLPAWLGYVTYISTRQPVELAFCKEITEVLTERADMAAESAENYILDDQEEGFAENSRELLEESMYLTLVNHMITSQEYEIAVENILHYLMGRNVQSLNYLDDREERSGRVILLLSEILNWQREHESMAE